MAEKSNSGVNTDTNEILSVAAREVRKEEQVENGHGTSQGALEVSRLGVG
jgi:hypothetical protein